MDRHTRRAPVALLVTAVMVAAVLGGCPKQSTYGGGPVPPPVDGPEIESPPVEITPVEATPAPDFTLPAAGGGEVRLADYRGKVLVLDFWATFCTGCVKALPAYQALVDSWDPERVAYLGISLDDSVGQIEAFLQTRPELKLPMALGSEEVVQDYLGGRRTLPSARVIDADGMIRYAFSTDEQPARVKAAVAALLTEPVTEQPLTDTVEQDE